MSEQDIPLRNGDEEKKVRNSRRVIESYMQIFEFYLWLILALIAFVPFFIDYTSTIREGDRASVAFLYAIKANYAWTVIGFFVSVFPIVFRLVFSSFPFQYLRESRNRTASAGWYPYLQPNHIYPYPISYEAPETATATVELPTDSKNSEGKTIALMQSYAASSKSLSEKMRGRANLHLLVGVLVAFSGLLFFYLRSATFISSPDLTQRLFDVVPSFGILFFIELIAFFFLRQYRAATDEFRYFEAIARKREEGLAALNLVQESGGKIELAKIIEGDFLRSSPDKLGRGETTDLLESRRLEKGELEILERIVSLISRGVK